MHSKKPLDQFPMATAVHQRIRNLPAIWIIPIIAAGLGIWLATQAVLKSGPTVTLTFESAEGLEAGKTKIRYKNVDIGDVKDIALSKDRTQVIVTAEFVKEAADFLVEDTQFWVVRKAPGCLALPLPEASSTLWISRTRRRLRGKPALSRLRP